MRLAYVQSVFFAVTVCAVQEFSDPQQVVHFNSTNFYLNATCKLNVAIGTITAVGSSLDLSYQLFGSQDFTVHKHRGDVIMVKKPKDPYPLFYISAVDPEGISATAVVEVSHKCPTVSFDAVSYHFFALRRAPSSPVGHLKASGGDDIRYSTESEVFRVEETTGTIFAKVILPIDTTSIFYVKAADRKGNTDVAEVVVEVIGCYMDVDVQHERRYNVVFEKRCYVFVLTSCELGVIAGTVRAKGYPEPTYEYRDNNFYLNPDDGVIMVKKGVEPGTIYQLNVLAKNGQEPDNVDVTLVTVDTRQCPPLSTTPTPLTTLSPLTTRSPLTTPGTSVTFNTESVDENGNSIPVSDTPLPVFDIFDGNETLSEDDPSAYNGTVEDPYPLSNDTEIDFFNWGNAATPDVADWSSNSTTTTTTTTATTATATITQKPPKNSSFVIHFTSVNISKTVKPVYVQKANGGKIFVKSARPKATLSEDGQGMEIV